MLSSEKNNIIRVKALNAYKKGKLKRAELDHIMIQDFVLNFEGFKDLRKELKNEICWKKFYSSFDLFQVKDPKKKIAEHHISDKPDFYILISGKIDYYQENLKTAEIEKISEFEDFAILNKYFRTEDYHFKGFFKISEEVEEVYFLKVPFKIHSKFILFPNQNQLLPIPEIIQILTEKVSFFSEIPYGKIFTFVLRSNLFKVQKDTFLYTEGKKKF